MKKLPPASSVSPPVGAPSGDASSPVSSSPQLSTLNPQRPAIPDHELLRRIGGGSYGEVWLARNALGAYRAVKIVHRITFDHDRPFEREFAGIQKFEPISRSHEGLVDLLQVGRNDAEGYFYYVMELADDAGENPKLEIRNPKEIRSSKSETDAEAALLRNSDLYVPRTLRSLLRPNTQPSTLNPQPTARLPLDECIQLGLSLTNALAFLHGQGLVHRDIKPSNIIFVGGVPKLADVGLVTGVDEARSYVGTEGFIPPEGPGSTQADLYSLGILLYVMSTGKSHQDFPEPLADFASQPDHARWLEFNTVIHKACRAQVRERYQTAEKMHADLELLRAGQSVKRLHLVERRLALLTRVGVLAIVAVIAAGVFYQTIRERKIATRSLVRSNVATGSRLMNEGDLFGALLSFTAALQLDAGDAKREESHRIRIASVLRQCPKLVGVFAHGATINQAGFSPDSRLVITASDDNTAQGWDLATGRPRLTLRHRGPVLSAAFSPDAKRIATTGSDNLVRFWNADTGKSLETHPIRHVARYDASPPQFSPDGLRILTVIQPMDLQIWNVVTGETIGQPLRHDREVTGFTFSPDGRYVFTVGGDNRVRLWDATTAALLPTDFEHVGLENGAFSPDGRILATGGHDDLAHLWDLTAGKELPPPLQHRDWVTSVAFSPESDRLVTASRDNTVEVWDLAMHPSPLRLLVHEARVFGANFSPDGRRIVTASQGNQVRMWDADSTVLLAPLLKHDTALGPVLFSPDGHLILTLQRAEAVRVWDLAVLEPPPLRIRPIAGYSEKSSFSLDAQFKATISPRDNTIRTFEVSSGKPLTQPLTQTPQFRQAFFGSDNAILVTENADSHARVWELATGEPLTPLLKTCYDLNAPKLSKAVLAQQNSSAARLPAAELVLLAQLLSGSQMDERGGIRPLERSDVVRAWEKLTKICPEMFTDSTWEVFAWHDQEARACEQAWDWWPARFHLEYLLAVLPNDQTLQHRHAYARLALDSARKKAKGHQEQMREIPPRDPPSAPETVDLSDFYNLSLKTPSKNDLADLPAGLRDFGRTRFDVRGILQLSGQMDAATGTNYPHRINGIKIGRKCYLFHFLHASSFEAHDGTDVGSYVVHYADNKTEVIPIKYGKDVRSCWTVPGEPLDTQPSALIWMGTNPHAQSIKSRSLRLFKSSWENLRPDVQVVSFDFVSSSDNAGPFLVAITTE